VLSPSGNDVWAFYTQFLCDFKRVLVHFGGWLSGKITPKIQENIIGVGSHVAYVHLDKASVANKKIFRKREKDYIGLM